MSSAAALGAVAAIVFGASAPPLMFAAAMGGAAGAMALLAALTWRSTSAVTFILAGTVLASLAGALTAFLAREVADARERGVLFSVHLKATMMKVSDPIIFGHAVRAYFADVFEQYADELASVGADPNQGLGGVLSDVERLPEATRTAIVDAIGATYERGPALAQVDSSRGITNLHVPSDVIIDASMPAAIHSSVANWLVLPAPEEPKFSLPGCDFASAISSAIVFVDIRFATVRIIGPRATIAIGVKSFTGSNGRLVWMAAFVVNELDCRTSV